MSAGAENHRAKLSNGVLLFSGHPPSHVNRPLKNHLIIISSARLAALNQKIVPNGYSKQKARLEAVEL